MDLDKIKIYVINLDKRPDRLSSLNIPLKWERFVATDGDIFINNKPKERGWRGCYDSHVRLMEQITNSEDGLYLIFEDDVELCDNFNDRLLTLLKSLPEDWELLFLGGHNRGVKIKYNEFLNLANDVVCMHAFLFKHNISEKLLNKFKSRVYKVDVLLCELLPTLNSYICSPTIAWQKAGYSNIEYIVTNNVHLR
jgi:GR25 family glycosyltransferase involved in LPS biosynthesis